jgi:hypothetical protein
MSTRGNRNLNVDGVTANQTPWWMHQDVVANGIAFGVKAF